MSEDDDSPSIQLMRGDVGIAVNLLSLLILKHGPVVFQEASLGEVEGMSLIIRRVAEGEGTCVASLMKTEEVEAAMETPAKKDMN